MLAGLSIVDQLEASRTMVEVTSQRQNVRQVTLSERAVACSSALGQIQGRLHARPPNPRILTEAMWPVKVSRSLHLE